MKVMITGATTGIGYAFAQYYANSMNNLIITGTTEKIFEIGETIREKYKCEVLPIVACIKETSDVDNLISLISNQEIDILVNNAGYGFNGYFFENDIERHMEMLQLHCVLVMKLTHYIGRKMIIRDNGIIINIASIGGYLPVPQNAIYASTKAFIIKLSESLYLDIKGMKKDVRVIAVCPGFTKTNFHKKLGFSDDIQKDKGIIKWATPESVVDKALHDLKKGKYISITGGFTSHFQLFLYNYLPKSLYNKIVMSLFRKRVD